MMPLALGFSFIALVLLADYSATLTGRVRNAPGAPIVDVEVLAINVETRSKFLALTNDEGYYRITNLQPGRYRLTLRKFGFQTFVYPGLELRVQDILSLNFEMRVGSQDETITMEEGTPLIQAETATLGQIIDRDVIAELPALTRNSYDFVGLAGGAVPALNSSGRGVGYAINGQRTESASFLLDGSEDNTNPGQKNPGQTLPSEAVREYRILTNGFTAEYGRSSGFIANLVTKSGANEFHGSVYDYVRNSALAANSFENNATGKRKNVFNGHQAGVAVGGPLVTDKTFFFGAFESILVRGSDVRTAYVPSPELLALSSPATRALFRKYPLPATLSNTDMLMRTVRPYSDILPDTTPVTLPAFVLASRSGPNETDAGFPQDAYLGTVRTDSTLTASMVLTARYSFEDVDRFPTIRQVYSPELDQAVLTRNQNATLNLTRIWSPNVVSDSRLAFSRLSTRRPEAGPNGLFQEFIIPGEPVRLPTGRQSEGGPRNLYQAHQIASWVRKNQHFKFGAEVIRYRDAVDVLLPGVWAQFSNVQGFVDGILERVTAWTSFLTDGLESGTGTGDMLVRPNRRWHLRYTDVALFAQDTWKITRRLTMTPGLRWEYFGVQSSAGHEKTRDVNFYLGDGASYYERFANGRIMRTIDAPGEYRNHFMRPDRNNFAPRLGLAFDLTGDGKSILRVGAGIFYDSTFARVPPLITRGVSFTSVPLTPEMLDDPYAIQGQAAGTPPAIDRVDPDRRISYSTAWNATIEREFLRNTLLSVSYVGSGSSNLDLRVVENGRGSGQYAGRPGERLLPNHSLFSTVKSLAHSSYHSFQIKAEGRRIRGLGMQVGGNYTWSHSIDNASASAFEGEGFAQGILLDPNNLRLDRASSSFDARHRFVTHFIWEIPSVWSRSVIGRHLAGGWQVSGILSFQTGQTFHVVDGGVPDVERTGRPRVSGPLPQVANENEMLPDPKAPNRFLYLRANHIRNIPLGTCIPNAAPFACLPSIYDSLNNLLPRNHYRRPGSHFQDVALTKNVLLSERARLQIRAEFYNVLNHANLELVPGADGGYWLTQPVFDEARVAGVLARYGGPPRQIVVAAKVIF